MVEKSWIFVSDAHFSGREPGKMETFLRFLDSEKERMGCLVILGDLFEFFFGFKGCFSPENPFPFAGYLPVLKGLQQLYGQGIHIKYLEGNHDFFLKTFFPEHFKMEVEVYADGSEERLGGKKTFVAHGDLANPRQWRYRAFRKILKNRWTYEVMQLAGPRLTCRVANRLSGMSYQRYHESADQGSPASFKIFAHRKFLEGFDVVILGHSHFPEELEERIEGRRCLYFNVGDWMTHRSYLRFIPPDHFELATFE